MLLARTRIATGKDEEGLAMARDLVTEADSDIGTHLEYALLLSATGRDQEARAMLTPYTTGKTVVPGAVRTLGAMELDADNLDAATTQFENLLATGTQSYEALYFLGVIAERRKDTERALRYYSRVAGGDYNLAAQQRVARIRAEQSGTEAGVAHLDELARTQPQLAPDVVFGEGRPARIPRRCAPRCAGVRGRAVALSGCARVAPEPHLLSRAHGQGRSGRSATCAPCWPSGRATRTSRMHSGTRWSTMARAWPKRAH